MRIAKQTKRMIYENVTGAMAYGRHILSGDVERDAIKVFYGGAHDGHRGGPQVKVGLLNQYFPQHTDDFNLLYLLSGALYLPPWAIRKLKDRGIPVAMNQNGVFYPAWFPKDWEAENARMARAMEVSDHVFYQSEFCKMCADKFIGVTPSSYEILYNGVDTNFFRPMSQKADRKRFRFLLTGNVTRATFYRLTNAIDTLAMARKQGLDVEFLFAGIIPQSLYGKFMASIRDKKMEAHFIIAPPFDRLSAPQVFADADAYFITKHNDPCPNAVLEAMACGLPVLYSASGGVPELVGTEAGVPLTVAQTFDGSPVPSPSDAVRGMADIMAHQEKMSAEARHRAQSKFDITLWADRHRVVFHRLLSGASS